MSEPPRTHEIRDLTVWRAPLRDRGTALPPNFTTQSNPTLANGIVVACLARPGAVHAVDRETGEDAWRAPLDAHGPSYADTDGARVYVASTETLYTFDVKTGELVWRFSSPGTSPAWLCGGTCVAGDRLFIGDEQGYVYCVHAETGGLIWQQRASDASNPPVIRRGLVWHGAFVSATNSREAFAFDVATGAERWRRRLDHTAINEVQVYGESIVVPTVRSVYLLDGESGEVNNAYRWRGLDLGGVYAAGHALYFLALRQWESKGPEVDEKPPTDGALVGLEDSKQLFDQAYASTILRVRGDPSGKYLYDCGSRMLQLLDAKTGETIHRVYSAEESLLPGLVAVQDGIIYLLNGNEVALYALRHPKD